MFKSGLVVLFGSAILWSQTLSISPNPVTLRMAATGPVAISQTISISAGGGGSVNWSATISPDAPWLSLSATAGTTPATISISPVSWRAESQPAGSYSGAITFAAPGLTPTTVNVVWTVVPRLPDPTFSYPSGPQSCTQPTGYIDPALCTVPDEKPPGSFQPPPLGGAYTDPNFGGNVKVISGPGVYHTYSANNPLSANNKYLMTYPRDGSFDIVETATGKVAFPRVPANGDFFWDSYDDSVYYYPKGAAFIKHDLSTGRDSTVIDYAKDGHKFTLIQRGGTTGSSKDNWISFFAPNETQLCSLDLSNVRTYCADYGKAPGIPYGPIDYTLDSKGVDKTSGKRFVILVAKFATPGVYSVNTKTGQLDLEFRGPEDPESNGNHNGTCDPGERCMYPSHSDTFEDSAGIQYLVFDSQTQSPCEVSTATYQLNKGTSILQQVELGGGKKKVLSLWRCPYPNSNGGTDEHIGCAKNAPFCVISTVPPYRSASDPPLRFPHATEIMVMRENGLEIRRLAESRSVRFKEEGDEAYWAMPKAAISNDGSLVVSDSNFGVPAGVRVTLITTGFGKRPMAVRNAASLSPNLAPGAYATLLGESLANCTASADPPGLANTLCGARVTFNAVPAKIAYASPRQINVLVPRSLPAKIDLAVSVSVDGADEPVVSAVPASDFTEAAPAIFSYALEDGLNRAVVQNASGVLNGPGPSETKTSAAVLGEAQVIWANALGPTDRTVPDGAPAPADPPAKTVRAADVFVNGVEQTVLFSGLSPGLSGIYQVNFVLSPNTPVMPEGQNFIWLQMGDIASPQLPISIQQI
jgi:uncharacterized protein (TIGR03437 family)